MINIEPLHPQYITDDSGKTAQPFAQAPALGGRYTKPIIDITKNQRAIPRFRTG